MAAMPHLSKIGDEENEVVGLRFPSRDPVTHEHRSNQETESLKQQRTRLNVCQTTLMKDTYNNKVLHQVEQIEGSHHPVFQSLVLIDGISVTTQLMLFAAEVLHGLIIEQTISVNASCDLRQ